MKKSVSVVLMLSLVGAMLFGLTACGNDDEVVDEVVDDTVVEDVVEDDTTVEDDTVVEDDTTVEDETPVMSEEEEIAAYAALNQKGIDALDAMFAEGSDTSAITAQSIVDKMKEVYGENYLPAVPVDATVFNDMTGLTSEDYTDYVGEAPMISMHADRIYVVKAAEGKVDTIKTALETYRQNQIDGVMQYPMNLTKWKGSQVVTYGDFVVFIMLGGYLDTPMNDEAVTDDTTVVDDTTVTDDTTVVDDTTVTGDTTVTDDTTTTDDNSVDATDSSTDTASDFS